MADRNNDEIEIIRIKYAFWLAIIGLGLSAALAVVLVINLEMKEAKAADIVSIVGVFTSVLGTLVGAFFGLQIGAAGTAHERSSRVQAEKDRRHAQDIAHMALGRLPPADAEKIVSMMKSSS